MLTYPQIDPILVQFGPFAIRWYGLMYLIGFLSGFVVIRHLARLRQFDFSSDDLGDLVFYAVLGVILGGRLGYVCFYNPGYYIHHPLDIPAVWKGGMSFHGGLLGVIAMGLFYCRRKGKNVLEVGDLVATAATLGLGCGRLGNFINGELWGRVTDLPWGMVFPGAGVLPRHPSQLYEFALEGPLLFGLLWWLHQRRVPRGVPFFTFIAGYGCIRFLIEFVRQPDQQLGLFFGFFSMGQFLSLPMLFLGLTGVVILRRRAALS